MPCTGSGTDPARVRSPQNKPRVERVVQASSPRSAKFADLEGSVKSAVAARKGAGPTPATLLRLHPR